MAVINNIAYILAFYSPTDAAKELMEIKINLMYTYLEIDLNTTPSSYN